MTAAGTYRDWYDRAEAAVASSGLFNAELAWTQADVASGERDEEGWDGDVRVMSEEWCARFLRLFTECLADDYGIDPAALGLKPFH